MASCFFLLKQFEDVLIYLNSIKVRVAGGHWFKRGLSLFFLFSLLSSPILAGPSRKESLSCENRVGVSRESHVGGESSPTSMRFSRIAVTLCDHYFKSPSGTMCAILESNYFYNITVRFTTRLSKAFRSSFALQNSHGDTLAPRLTKLGTNQGAFQTTNFGNRLSKLGKVM